MLLKGLGMRLCSLIVKVRWPVATVVALAMHGVIISSPVYAETLPHVTGASQQKGAVLKEQRAIQGAKSPNPITIRKLEDRNLVVIATKNQKPTFSINHLSNPARLVIDIDSERLPQSAGEKVSPATFVSAIRVGAHPSKTRVVIDLRAGAEVIHKATAADHAITVEILAKNPQPVVAANTNVTKGVKDQAAVKTVAHVAAQAEKKPATQKAELAKPQAVSKAAPLEKKSLLNLDEDVVVSGSSKAVGEKRVALDLPVAPVGAPREQNVAPAKAAVDQEAVTKAEDQQIVPVKKSEAINQVSMTAPANTNEVQSVVLEGQGKHPSLVLGVKGTSAYSLDRTAPSEYVLKLPGATASEALLKQTLFTSKESNGIRSVRTTRDGDNTLVRIFTQPSSYLTARRTGDRLVVEETQDLAQISRDIRAQIDPAAMKANTAPARDAAVPAKDANVQPVPAAQQVAAPNPQQNQPQQVVKQAGETKPTVDGKTGADSKAGTVAAAKQPAATQRSESELAAMKGNSSSYTGRLISLDLQDADIDSALRIIAEVSNLNIVAGDGVVGKVTLKLVDVPWDQALEVILKNHGLDKVLEGNVLRVAPVDKLKQERESFKQARVAEEELEPLSVKYMRISYAKASEIKALVETVLTERGSVAFDERSNQLVVKDVRKGLSNVGELLRKVDLRTPQILLETQIIEASRNLSRQLGSELGFQYIQSPATGNGTGLNFPSAIALGGSVDPTNANSITGAAFPIATSATAGSAVTMLFDSADGTKSLALRLSQLEQEGQVRIISKPAVATTNNKPAEIKSVEKYRVKLPNGGLSIATGAGAQSSGAGNAATETIEAGIVLNVTPQASPDYYILLDIQAKSSSFGPKTVEGIPNEIERSASSSVLVSSGQTFALGGIYKITERDSVSGVPFFKDIPVLGTFFRSATTENADEELLFFITPRIVEGSFEDASMKAVS
jgi:type IV pilus secretin PilQ/predicted competence protein